jgi:hypothetical protein
VSLRCRRLVRYSKVDWLGAEDWEREIEKAAAVAAEVVASRSQLACSSGHFSVNSPKGHPKTVSAYKGVLGAYLWYLRLGEGVHVGGFGEVPLPTLEDWERFIRYYAVGRKGYSAEQAVLAEKLVTKATIRTMLRLLARAFDVFHPLVGCYGRLCQEGYEALCKVGLGGGAHALA